MFRKWFEKGKHGKRGKKRTSIVRRGSKEVGGAGGRRGSKALADNGGNRSRLKGRNHDERDGEMGSSASHRDQNKFEENMLDLEDEMLRARDVLNSAHSYYSYVSDGGTHHVKRRRRREDGTYSDSESCGEDMMEKYEQIKQAKQLLGEEEVQNIRRRNYGKKKKQDGTPELQRKTSIPSPDIPHVALHGDPDRPFSVHSEVSDGGTRRRYKRKVIRDADGNVVGYGSPELYESHGESDEESIRIRRGSISEDDEEVRAIAKREMKRLQRMIERPTRRGGKDGGETTEKTWVNEVMDGLHLKQKQNQKSKSQTSANKLDVQGLGMPTAGDWATKRRSLMSIPEDDHFSDTTDEEPDLSGMTEEEKRIYLENREKRRHERERRMREKFGDKYDEMKRKRKEQKAAEARSNAEMEGGAEESVEGDKGVRPSGPRRDSTGLHIKHKQKPKSMVTYEKGPPRDVGGTIEKTDSRDIGPSHKEWTKKTPRHKDMPRRSRDDGFLFDFKPAKLPNIKLNIGGSNAEKDKSKPKVTFAEDTDEEDFVIVKETTPREKEDQLDGLDRNLFEVGADGQLKVKDGVELDINKLPAAMLRRLGIDPNLSKEEIAKRLKEKLGQNLVLKDGVFETGTKPISAYDLSKVTDEMLAADPELDINSLKGPRRVNVLWQRAGNELKEHMKRILDMCNLTEPRSYAKDLDETDSSIDFLSHYRLVDHICLEAYARAFVIEDRDLDTVISLSETQTALEGVTSIQYMTCKQMQYVLKVLNIDDASQVTFRMFAVITALCERVTQMDPISKHLLEMCNLADIERKLDLYKAMFYHNIKSDFQSNFITGESLKIELIAGGLSWKQQQYVMEKMEPNSWGEISFLDYMCYIPLFMSMHDNICDNPLDMSDQKYMMPPRKRPPSVQRDMNPLGQPLSKRSAFLMKKQARDLMEGKLDPEAFRKSHIKLLQTYSKLPDIDTFDKPKYDPEDDFETIDLIY